MKTIIDAATLQQLVNHVETWRPTAEIENAMCDWLDQLREDPDNAKIYSIDWMNEEYVFNHPTEGNFFRAKLSIRTLNEKTGARQAETVFVRISEDTFSNDGSEGWAVT